MLAWLVLGLLMHGIMIRVWERGVLSQKDLLMPEDLADMPGLVEL